MRDTRDADPHHTPHRDLWQAVLARLVEDATIGPDTSAAKPGGRVRIVREARAFLTEPSADLDTICLAAGLDPAAVMETMRKHLKDAPTPAQLVARGSIASRPAKPKAAPKPRPVPFAKQPVTIGHETLTVAEWAARNRLNLYTVKNRVRHGWTIHDALTISTANSIRSARQRARTKAHAEADRDLAQRGRPAKTYTHDNRTLTITQWAAITGLKAGTIKARLERGLPLAEALAVEDRRETGKRTITFNGQTRTIAQWAAITGLPAATIQKRLRAGLPPAEVLTTEDRRGRWRTTTTDQEEA